MATPENHLHNCMLSCRTLPESAKKSGAVYVNSCGGGVCVDFATRKRVRKMQWRARKATDRHEYPAKVCHDRKNRSEMRVSVRRRRCTSDKKTRVGREASCLFWIVAFCMLVLRICMLVLRKQARTSLRVSPRSRPLHTLLSIVPSRPRFNNSRVPM